jgi:hypothetical protein
MTAKSSMTGEELLEHPGLWREFHKRLSLGLDTEHDRETVHSFAEMLQLPVSRVVNKMRTYCHPASRTLN